MYGIFSSFEKPWILANVYVSTKRQLRQNLWTKQGEVDQLGLPMIITGAFNYIFGSDEKVDGNPLQSNWKSKDFFEFIHGEGLIDLGYSKPYFMWCNNRNELALILKHIDKVLANDSRLSMYSDVAVAPLTI